MERDFDLIRQILLTVREQPAGVENSSFVIDGIDDQVLAEHVTLLIEAGLLKGSVRQLIGAPRPQIRIERLTWAGQDFVDAMPAPVWIQARERILKLGGSISFEVLVELLKALSLSRAGL